MTERQSLTTLDRPVPRGTHMCVFFGGPAERDHIVVPFLAEGIRAGQKCICILESPGAAEVLERLGQRVDLGRSVETGQLELGTPADAYLRSGTFSTDDMPSYREQAAGEMPSVLDHLDGRREFFRYEAGLTGFIAGFPQVILCLYKLQRWGPGS